MNYQMVKFVAAYGTSAQVPASTSPEVSFVGRSNVGKSSIMNKIFGRKGLVKVSSTPGKTSTINFFDVEGATFVDLPGYGFAKVAKSEKGRWSELIEGYFAQDRRFALVVSLIDIRHDATKDDLRMVSYLEERELPYLVAFTKADKLSKAQQQKQVASISKQLAAIGANPIVVTTSSERGQGIDDLRALIEDAISQAS
ncbi:MAG: YihA family ribosome biogenesis GTP-binding protein [Eggerthellaceae bacterium]|nr:YihA family ribosome biogenesis GTP-binding protein [Eggerthellaceae bacterium]